MFNLAPLALLVAPGGFFMSMAPPAPLVASVSSPEIEESIAAEIADKPSPETRRSYEHVWRYYRAWLATQPLRVVEARPKHVQRYLSKLRDEDGLKKGTIARASTVIRVLYGALVRDEIMATNPAREVKSPKVDSTPNAPWIQDPTDIFKLLNVPAANWVEKRDRMIVRLAFGLGWRRSNVARVTLEDIEGETISAIVKGGKAVTVGLPDWLAEDIREWCQFAGITSGPLFLRSEHGDRRQINGAIVYRVVRQMCARAGIEVVSPHSLRRSYVTHSGLRGVDMKKIQGAVSHSSIVTTEKYSKANLTASTKVGDVFVDLVRK